MKCSSFNCELVSKLSNFLRPFPENETREAAVEFLQLNYSLIKFGAEKTFVLSAKRTFWPRFRWLNSLINYASHVIMIMMMTYRVVKVHLFIFGFEVALGHS